MIHGLPWQASVSVMPSLKRYDVDVRNDDLLEEQVKSLIHEFFHISLEEDYLINCPVMLGNMNVEDYNVHIRRIERQIDCMSEGVYTCQPMLVRHLRELILRSRQKD